MAVVVQLADTRWYYEKADDALPTEEGHLEVMSGPRRIGLIASGFWIGASIDPPRVLTDELGA